MRATPAAFAVLLAVGGAMRWSQQRPPSAAGAPALDVVAEHAVIDGAVPELSAEDRAHLARLIVRADSDCIAGSAVVEGSLLHVLARLNHELGTMRVAFEESAYAYGDHCVTVRAPGSLDAAMEQIAAALGLCVERHSRWDGLVLCADEGLATGYVNVPLLVDAKDGAYFPDVDAGVAHMLLPMEAYGPLPPPRCRAHAR